MTQETPAEIPETEGVAATSDRPMATSDDQPSPEASPDTNAQDDLKLRLFLQSMSLVELEALLEKRRKMLGDDAYVAQAQTANTYENVLTVMTSDYSEEATRSREVIGQIADKTQFDKHYVADGKILFGGAARPKIPSGGGKSVSGAEGRMRFAIRGGNMKRVKLYNSGFAVDIMAPSLAALNTFFTKTHTETTTYGREFGAYYYHFNDLLIKEAVAELIAPLVLNSNLRHWNRGNTLNNNIKLPDHKAILMGIASLMFPDGLDFTHVCTNPKGTCNYHEEKLIDLNNLVLYNFAKLGSTAIDIMSRRADATPESITAYQNDLIGGDRILRHGRFEFEMQTPSVQSYLEYGRIFNGAILSSNFADTAHDVYRTLMYSFYRIYTPYIAKITLYDEAGDKDIETQDPDVIAEQLAFLQSEDPDRLFRTKLTNFINDSEIMHCAYPGFACPNCNYVPPGGYYTVDPEHAFFIMCLMRLRQS